MTTVEAIYFDGRSARKLPVTIKLQGGEVHVLGAEVNFIVPFELKNLTEKLGRAPRTLHFADGGHCLIKDHAGLQAMLQEAGYPQHSLVSGLESRWTYAGIALLFTLLAVVAAYIWGLPILAKEVAERVPPEMARKMDEQTLLLLGKHALQPTQLTATQQQKITGRLQSLLPPEGDTKPDFHLVFKNSEIIGPNAFALPGGTILVTDQLVKLAAKAPASDDQVTGVLAHELGHVAHRHALRQFLQGSIVAVVMTWYLGDISSLLASVPTALLETRYSRALESEADDYAIATMQRNHISPGLLADMLVKLESFYQVQGELEDKSKPDAKPGMKQKDKAKHEDEDVLEGYFSTHPLTKDRIDKLRSAR